ncbi:MAG: hypothetical protein KF881_01090 [Acidobacteria bacterium]|nr:hypothetical protein [Acidobacteriota bacterium]
MTIERLFQIMAVVLAGTAAYLYSAGYNDLFFVVSVLAAVSFFLSIRAQVKARNLIREARLAAELERRENSDQA